MKDMTKVVVADALTVGTLAAGFQITLSVIMRYCQFMLFTVVHMPSLILIKTYLQRTVCFLNALISYRKLWN